MMITINPVRTRLQSVVRGRYILLKTFSEMWFLVFFFFAESKNNNRSRAATIYYYIIHCYNMHVAEGGLKPTVLQCNRVVTITLIVCVKIILRGIILIGVKMTTVYETLVLGSTASPTDRWRCSCAVSCNFRLSTVKSFRTRVLNLNV